MGASKNVLITDGAGNENYSETVNAVNSVTVTPADSPAAGDVPTSQEDGSLKMEPQGAGTDANAIHDNVAGEIAAVTTKATPVSGDFILIEDSADSNNKKKVSVGTLPTVGGGEANTTSNGGTGGVGIVLPKNGIDLPFKSINAGSAKITVTDDATNDNVDIDVDPAEISHTAIADIGSNTHAQIDTAITNSTNHIANTANPHGTDVENLGSGTLAELSDAITDATEIVGTANTQTLTNKTLALGSNTVSGTLAEFNTAISDADVAKATDIDEIRKLTQSAYDALTPDADTIYFIVG